MLRWEAIIVAACAGTLAAVLVVAALVDPGDVAFVQTLAVVTAGSAGLCSTLWLFVGLRLLRRRHVLLRIDADRIQLTGRHGVEFEVHVDRLVRAKVLDRPTWRTFIPVLNSDPNDALSYVRLWYVGGTWTSPRLLMWNDGVGSLMGALDQAVERRAALRASRPLPPSSG